MYETYTLLKTLQKIGTQFKNVGSFTYISSKLKNVYTNCGIKSFNV